MILAAADFAEQKGPPPYELALYLECRSWRALPKTGGILEQPAGLLKRMETCREVWQAVQAYAERKPGAEAAWKQAHSREWAIVKGVRKLRKGTYGT